MNDGAKSGRDLPGRVRARASRGSREDPGVLGPGTVPAPEERANYIRSRSSDAAWNLDARIGRMEASLSG